MVQFLGVSTRFKQVDRPFYEVKTTANQGESHTTVTQSGDILQSMGIPLKEDILDSIRKGKENSPIQALEELEGIKRELNTEALKSLAARVGDISLLKTLTLESSRVLFLQELAKRNKVLVPTEQTAILGYLSQQKGIRDLILPNFTFLNDTLLQKISLEHLIKLDLRKCTSSSLTTDSLLYLSQIAPNLQELNLGYLTQLRTIGNIQTNWLGTQVAENPIVFKALRYLSLSNCTNLIKFLLQAPKLHYLNIENCSKLTDQMLDGVIEHSENLQSLKFERCPLITEGEFREKYPNFPVSFCIGIAKAEIIEILETLERRGSLTLDLEGKGVPANSQGLRWFIKALKIGNIRSLYLGSNDIEDEEVQHLANGNLSNLISLDLRMSNIGDARAQSLANGNLSNLTSLNLWCNNIGVAGAQSLANGNLSSLTLLDLEASDIGDAGAQYLANGNLSNLRELNLRENKIGDEGAESLANGNLSKLTWLSLEENNIGAEAKKALRKRYPNADIHF